MYANYSQEESVKKQTKNRQFSLICTFKYAINRVVYGKTYTAGKNFTHSLVAPNINSEDKCYCLEGKSNGAKNINYDHCCQGLLEPCGQLCWQTKKNKQQMENKWRRTKKEVKTEFTTAVMLLPARLRQFNGSLIAIVSAYIQSSKTSGSLKLFFLRFRCLMSITLFHKFGEMTQSDVSWKHINMGCRNLFSITCRGRPWNNMLESWSLRSNPNMSQSWQICHIIKLVLHTNHHSLSL